MTASSSPARPSRLVGCRAVTCVWPAAEPARGAVELDEGRRHRCGRPCSVVIGRGCRSARLRMRASQASSQRISASVRKIRASRRIRNATSRSGSALALRRVYAWSCSIGRAALALEERRDVDVARGDREQHLDRQLVASRRLRDDGALEPRRQLLAARGVIRYSRRSSSPLRRPMRLDESVALEPLDRRVDLPDVERPRSRRSDARTRSSGCSRGSAPHRAAPGTRTEPTRQPSCAWREDTYSVCIAQVRAIAASGAVRVVASPRPRRAAGSRS